MGKGRSEVVLERGDARAAQVLLVLLPVLHLALVLGPPLLAWVSGDPLRWTSAVSLAGPAVVGLDRPGVAVTWSDSVDWVLADPSAGQRLAALVPDLVTWLLLVAGCLLAWGLVRTALAGQPFVEAAPRRLRLLALVVIGYGAVVPALQVLASMVVLWRADQSGALAWVVDLSGPLVAVVVGLLVLVVGECFRIGRRLAADVDGLV